METAKTKTMIAQYTNEMIDQIARLVKYNSVQGEALPGKPFGQEPAAVLAEALAMAEELGFKTVNLDNYCGYAEMGEGEDIIGIAGHLDIVPVGDGWSYDPLTVTRVGDKIYGRGVTDDKGPVIMALYAMKFLRDSGMKLNKRVRLIMGCNEESGSRCMEHYVKVAEPVTMGFTPDANFPCIHGEKGMMALIVRSKETKIISMNGGFVTNAVCHQCTTVIPAEGVSVEALEASLAATPLVSFTVTPDPAAGTITIYVQGLAAHASTPLLGVNAASYTMVALKAAGFEDPFVDYYLRRIGTTCDGVGLDLKLEDECSDLSFNNGIVKTENGQIICTIDMRVPVTVTEDILRARLAPYLDEEEASIEIVNFVGSLYYPKESELVKALYGAYVEVTGDTSHEPMVIGGGTYAKSLSGIIAFGPEKPGIDYCIHNADEFMDIPGMQQAVEIYMRAIENMLAI